MTFPNVFAGSYCAAKLTLSCLLLMIACTFPTALGLADASSTAWAAKTPLAVSRQDLMALAAYLAVVGVLFVLLTAAYETLVGVRMRRKSQADMNSPYTGLVRPVSFEALAMKLTATTSRQGTLKRVMVPSTILVAGVAMMVALLVIDSPVAWDAAAAAQYDVAQLAGFCIGALATYLSALELRDEFRRVQRQRSRR